MQRSPERVVLVALPRNEHLRSQRGAEAKAWGWANATCTIAHTAAQACVAAQHLQRLPAAPAEVRILGRGGPAHPLPQLAAAHPLLSTGSTQPVLPAPLTLSAVMISRTCSMDRMIALSRTSSLPVSVGSRRGAEGPWVTGMGSGGARLQHGPAGHPLPLAVPLQCTTNSGGQRAREMYGLPRQHWLGSVATPIAHTPEE